MVMKFRQVAMAGLALFLALPTLAIAQDINLANGGADQKWRGTKASARAGAWMDLGDMSGDGRRDLIATAPGVAGVSGAVYVIYGGPERSGEFSLANADVVITHSDPSALFGTSTAAGNVITADGTNPRNLAIGAPGVSGGRGAVYVYTSGWPTSTALTQANALYTIVGAPGDQLGTALATGDLDHDGRRELIIGAPGNNRVYIIKGSASLSGTLNLETTPAAQTLTAAGIGGVLSAGDITGDGIYDLLVGSATQNVVFAYAGTNGAIAAVPVISFSGANAGDLAGTAVRVLDLDADGATDVVIGAPGGDGPGNARANAGNVYVFFGPIANGAKSVNQAQAVIYGAAANANAGFRISTGDINRDTPNDLVILASGGSGGAGELDIYYGRARSAMGTVSGSWRVIDFAIAGQVNRRILGDPATGSIASAQPYEVTGEGARDVIVGVPGEDGNRGALYFTISPRLRVSRATETLVANKGGSATSSTAITVMNPSVVVTGWQATSSAAWLSASPSSGSVVESSPASMYIVAQTGLLAGGVYTGTINVSATSPDLTMTLPIEVTFTVLDARVTIDSPANGATVANGLTITGWALDLSAPSGTGIDAVQAYAFPTAGGPQIYLGSASYGGARPDVGAAFGSRFTNSAFSLTVGNLTPGASYRLVVFARSTVTHTFSATATANVTVTTSSAPAGPTPPDPNSPPLPDPNTAPPGPNPGPGPTPNPNTRVAVNRSALTFGATNNGAMHTGAQTATVSFTNGGSTWSVASDQNWLTVSPATGSGSGAFSVTVNDGTYTPGATRTATLTVTAPGVANSPLTIPVTLHPYGGTTAPVGLVDTPADHVTGVAGSLPVTGWAVDDLGIAQVTLWRDPLPGEPASSANGKVFIGTAVPVDGARPDVDATFQSPYDYQAGWGYLLLTNMLPNQGNGTFRLHAYATDVEGNTVLLGSRTITCDNAHATAPFGSIDTPDQGGTVSGTGYVNFGWALTPQPNQIPTDGSTITVYIDGVPIGHPTYNGSRSDITTLFPGYANTNGAIGYMQFNSTQLANGVHTIAWGVVDNAGNAAGIGSRYFSVLNGSSSSVLASTTTASTFSMFPAATRESAPSAGQAVGQPVASLDWVPAANIPTYAQNGFGNNSPLELADAGERGSGNGDRGSGNGDRGSGNGDRGSGNGDRGPGTGDRRVNGAARVKTEELGLVRVTLGPAVFTDTDGYEGYLVKGRELAALPAGSFLDKKTGEFFWQPGPGFVGTYEFVFVRNGSGVRTKSSLTVKIDSRKHEGDVRLPSRIVRWW
jgi:hypothetical protein